MARLQWLVGILLLVGWVTSPAQEISSLAQAWEFASGHAAANRLASTDITLARGQGMESLKGILPTVRAEAGWLRTTDPLNAFGFTLRRRAATLEAFAPTGLNDPRATSLTTSALVLEQPVLNLDAWLGRSAGKAAIAAQRNEAQWVAQEIQSRVLAAWFGGILTLDKVTTLQAAWNAALSHAKLSQALWEQGLVTRTDQLLAQVAAGNIEAELVAAQADHHLAAERLGLLIGLETGARIKLPAALPSQTALQEVLEHPTGSEGNGLRADLAAARHTSRAAQLALSSSRATALPRINGFARYDWNTLDAVYSGKESWTIGVQVSWAPFTGAAELAAVEIAKAKSEAARIQAEALEQTARLEILERRSDLAVAFARLKITTAAVAQSVEAHRLASRRYSAGLSPITELLTAAAAETRSRLEASAAVFAAITAAAEWRRAQGLSLDPILALDTKGTTP